MSITHKKNAFAGYVCHCRAGWSLQNDLKTCKEQMTELKVETNSNEVETKHESDSDEYYDNNEADNEIVECTIHDHEECSPGSCIVINHNNKNNNKGKKQCQCPSGFMSHFDKCIDVDECIKSDDDDDLHQCSHDCHNTFGSFYCSCPNGLILSDDRETCVDFDECSHDTNICGDLTCRNSYGSFKCLCENGEDADEKGKCQTQSLCDINNGGCSQWVINNLLPLQSCEDGK